MFCKVSGIEGTFAARELSAHQVSDAHVTVSASQSSGTRTWHSQEASPCARHSSSFFSRALFRQDM